jgi:peptide/nickel transport system substrate-binding protein
VYVGGVLRALGYRARLRVIDSSRVYREVGNPRYHLQLILDGGWLPDYPSPYNFFHVLLSCAAVHAPARANWAFFCNRRIDGDMDRAHSLETGDPKRAALLWARVEREVVDQAPIIPYVNTRNVDFVSRRVGNYQYNPQWGALLDQLWVK